jgi:uroporphyrinogen-III synthase
VKVGAVGPATAERLAEVGLPADVVASGGGIELARALIEEAGLAPGSRVLLPQSDIARPELEEILVEAGAAVDAVAIYSTVPAGPQEAAPFLDALSRGERVDAVTFASPSAVRAFLEITGERGRRLLESPEVKLVAIGPTTAGALDDEGLAVAAQARSPSAEGLAEAVVRALALTS